MSTAAIIYTIVLVAAALAAGYWGGRSRGYFASVRDAALLRTIAAAMTPHEPRLLPLGKWADKLCAVADRMERASSRAKEAPDAD